MDAQNTLNQHAADFARRYGSNSLFAVMLYGSQNYHLDTPASDVDSKAMLLPSFNDFALKQKWLSNEHEVAGGLMNVKDVRAMFENFLKTNVNFLECLYTKYTVVSPTYQLFWNELVTNRDMVANSNPLRLLHAAAGMASQKYHALEKPFESKKHLLAEYGYDAKQLNHLCRLKYLMADYLYNLNFGACLVPRESQLQFLFEVKAYTLTLEEARELAQETMMTVNSLCTSAGKLFEKTPNTAVQAKEYLNDFVLRLLRVHLKNELTK